MNRRQFLNYAVATTMLAAIPRAWGASRIPEIAFTFDDPTTDGGAGLTWAELNDRMLATLDSNNLKSILFVCGKRVDSNSGSQLIAAWDGAGHLISNHSYSHLNFNSSTDDDGSKKVTLAEFEADALKNEPLIRDSHHFTRLFRYPFFKEGDTVEKRDGIAPFCNSMGIALVEPPLTPPTGRSMRGCRSVWRPTLTPTWRDTEISFFSTSGSAPSITMRCPSACSAARCDTPCCSITEH
jgi:peptidoglycan/xylan/chitin deacetylase (PgdA/CDA1 family)